LVKDGSLDWHASISSEKVVFDSPRFILYGYPTLLQIMAASGHTTISIEPISASSVSLEGSRSAQLIEQILLAETSENAKVVLIGGDAKNSAIATMALNLPQIRGKEGDTKTQ
jgi:hypothetical protein